MKKSAGILLYRFMGEKPEVFLVHPGGPFWKNKDAGAWSVPKGEFVDGEDALEAAKREFQEETGMSCDGNFIELRPLKQSSGKLIFAWALEKDIDAAAIKSNEFEMELPPRSGSFKAFPEVDRGQWFLPGEAVQKINTGQGGFITELMLKLNLDQKP